VLRPLQCSFGLDIPALAGPAPAQCARGSPEKRLDEGVAKPGWRDCVGSEALVRCPSLIFNRSRSDRPLPEPLEAGTPTLPFAF
jgi:hypothetical protein